MPSTVALTTEHCSLHFPALRAAVFLCFFVLACTVLAHAQYSVSPDDNTITFEAVPDQEVIVYGKNVVIRKQAKGVLAIGGDITVEGRVEGDVAAIGGSVYQLEGAFIGGDVFVLGGQYRPDGAAPLRTEGKETVMYAGYEEELRHLSQNPTELFAPSFSLTFLAQRALSMLFWFVVTLGITTLAPGAVSRAITRFNLSTLKVIGLGFSGLVLTTIAIIGSLSLLPSYLSAILGLMSFSLLLLAFVFGRVALQVSTGQILQRRFLTEGKRSEAIAIFIGVGVWTLILSVPYLWSLAIVALFSAGIGLVLTSRTKAAWRTA